MMGRRDDSPAGAETVWSVRVPLAEIETEALAARIRVGLRREEALAPITDGRADFDLADAYRVSARILARRIARGERPVGWKIGFTNRTIWDEYGVHVSI